MQIKGPSMIAYKNHSHLPC